MTSWQVLTRSADETEALGFALGQLLFPTALILLHGELGAGKTCLTRGVARGFGVPADEPVTSPTYALMHHYHGRCDLYHFDLYRLAGTAELDEIGFDEFALGNGAAIVEWSERAAGLKLEGLRINLKLERDEEQRLLEFSAETRRYQLLLEDLSASWVARVQDLTRGGCREKSFDQP